jgi:hypothetical protein
LLNNSFTQLRIELGEAFLPALAALLPPLTTVVKAAASLVEALQPAIRAVAGLVAFGYVVPSIVSFVGAISGVVAIFSATKWISNLALLAGLPGPIRLLAAAFTLLGVAASPLGPILNAVVIALTALQFINFAKGFIAFIPGTIAALTGFIGFLSGTMVPALLAFFSGPVGWTVLAIAAVVAMAIAFREPLMKFASWLWEWSEFAREPFVRLWNAVVGIVTTSLELIGRGVEAWGAEVRKIWSGDFSTLQGIVETWRDAVVDVWNAMGEAFNTYLVEPIRNTWTALTEFLPRAMETVRERVVGVWTYVINVIRNVFRSVLQFIANGINSLIDKVNYVIRGYNSIPVAPDIPQLGYVTVPAFAQGGVASRPTLAMVGDGGEDEYIIPASKMQAASSRFLSGARGASVIPSSSSTGPSRTGTTQINVRTGPVMQQQDGSRWVSMEDYEQGLQQLADQLIGTLRTPQARIVLRGA